MSRYSLGVTTTNTTNTQVVEIINSHNTASAFLKVIDVALNTAAATVVGFGRPAAAGITPTSPVALVDEQSGADGIVTTALAWGTGPTAPAKFLRKFGFPATIGSAATWEFAGKGFRLGPGQTAVVSVISGTSSILHVSFEVEQDAVRTNS
jgi:hypothetical protein